MLAFAGHFVAPQMLGLKTLAVNDYKGVAYARKFPDAKKVYESASPFGFLEVYSSSYLHFAPGLSDNAGFNLPTMPANAYLGLYIDGDGPIGVMRDLTDKETAYFRFLPMFYPYVIKSAPKTFIIQFGGGISTEVALHSGAKDVTVAEGNRAVLEAFHDDVIRNFTGDILSKVHVIGYEGRHFLAQTAERFDVIDSHSRIRSDSLTPAASPSSRSSPTRRRRWRPICARSLPAAYCRSLFGTRRSRRSRF